MSDDLLIRSLGWGIHRIGKYTILSILLLVTGISCLVAGLAGGLRGIDTGLLLMFSLASLFLGWWLARSRQPGWLAAVESGLAAAAIIFLQVGQMSGAFGQVGRFWLGMTRQGWPWRPVDWAPFLAALAGLGAPFQTLMERLVSWSSGTVTGEAAIDPVAMTLAWSFILWAVAGWAGWSIRRWGAVLPGMAPAGALLAVILNFTRENIYTLLPFLTALLLLKFGIDVHRREQRWQKERIDYPEDVPFDMWVVTLGLTLSIVSLASLAPSLSIRKMADLVQRFTQEQNQQVQQIGESLGLERSLPTPRAFNHWYAPGLPRSHMIGAGPELSQQLVMRIQTGDLPTGPPDVILRGPVPRYYWRGLTYNRYTGRGWVTSQVQIIDYPAGAVAEETSLPAHRLIQQRVQFAGNQDFEDKVLFAAGSLLSVDQGYAAEWRRAPVEKNEAAPDESELQLNSDLFGATIRASAYQANSWVAAVSAEQLNAASQDYPDWVLKRYLSLPESLPTRVFSLARDITATQPTPYERARVIETYLRSYPYTLDLPEPPEDRDIVDYFLFDLKRGYCDYYASAMVVLARAAGLPARLVIGYATGEYDPLSASFIVTEANAHSWPEIYFPGYGWIEFEPTAGQPPLERPDSATSEGVPQLDPGEETSSVSEALPNPVPQPLTWLKWAVGILGLTGLGILVLALVDSWHLRTQSPPDAVTNLFRRLYRYGRQLEVQSDLGDTPYEFTSSFARRIANLGRGNRWEHSVSPADVELRRLADVYTQSLYSRTQPGRSDQALAIKTWERLRWRLWLARLIRHR